MNEMNKTLRGSISAAAFCAGLVSAVFAEAAAPEAATPDVTKSVPSFRQDVMPIFFRAGCNAGSCHGASRGKDGFMLSLFGYDPQGDYFRVTQEMAGRRVNVASPE